MTWIHTLFIRIYILVYNAKLKHCKVVNVCIWKNLLAYYSIGVYHSTMITVAETHTFQKKVSKILSDKERNNLISYIASHPNAGDILQGTGGIRKLRWRKSGIGKSGGIRVIYYYHDEWMPLYLLTVFDKGEKANMTKSERNQLSKVVKELVSYWRSR